MHVLLTRKFVCLTIQAGWHMCGLLLLCKKLDELWQVCELSRSDCWQWVTMCTERNRRGGIICLIMHWLVDNVRKWIKEIFVCCWSAKPTVSWNYCECVSQTFFTVLSCSQTFQIYSIYSLHKTSFKLAHYSWMGSCDLIFGFPWHTAYVLSIFRDPCRASLSM